MQNSNLPNSYIHANWRNTTFFCSTPNSESLNIEKFLPNPELQLIQSNINEFRKCIFKEELVKATTTFPFESSIK